MAEIERSAILPYSVEKMFKLVNAVEDYPEFLPWCHATEVHQSSGNTLEASIVIKKGPISQRFKTRNTLTPHSRMDMDLISGPFRQFDGHWEFEPIGDRGSRLTFKLHYELESRTLSKLFDKIFHEIADTMVTAFAQRAQEVFENETL